MLNLTSSMWLRFGILRPLVSVKRNLIYFGVAGEESGSAYGAQWMADNYQMPSADYVLTENGGFGGPSLTFGLNERWRKRGCVATCACTARQVTGRLHLEAITLSFEQQRSCNALLTIAHPHVFMNVGASRQHGYHDETKAIMLDPNKIDDYLESFPHRGAAAHLWSCCHTTMSPNVVAADHILKTNVILIPSTSTSMFARCPATTPTKSIHTFRPLSEISMTPSMSRSS